MMFDPLMGKKKKDLWIVSESVSDSMSIVPYTKVWIVEKDEVEEFKFWLENQEVHPEMYIHVEAYPVEQHQPELYLRQRLNPSYNWKREKEKQGLLSVLE